MTVWSLLIKRVKNKPKINDDTSTNTISWKMKCIYKNNLHDTHRRLTRILIHEIRYNTFQNDPLQVCESAVNIKMARKPILCQSVGWFEGQLLIDLSLLSSLLLSCLLHHYAAALIWTYQYFLLLNSIIPCFFLLTAPDRAPTHIHN